MTEGFPGRSIMVVNRNRRYFFERREMIFVISDAIDTILNLY
ncbi:hypothetical protein [[Phormidium] sp. ETS-05]|nr:hypothetical protein [[Phormidium] sp. ETS-05]